MARYINADAVEKYFNREEWRTPDEKWWPEREIGMIFDLFSTADVVEVVHGKWVFKDDNPLIPTGYWSCSNCNEGKLLYKQNYCPHCGADMRGRREDGN